MNEIQVPLEAIQSEWHPLNTQVMIVPDQEADVITDEQTGSTLLHLPENRYKQLPRGRVYRVGAGVFGVAEGDSVFWLRSSETMVHDDAIDQVFAIVPEGQIILRKPKQNACL